MGLAKHMGNSNWQVIEPPNIQYCVCYIRNFVRKTVCMPGFELWLISTICFNIAYKIASNIFFTFTKRYRKYTLVIHSDDK